MKFNVNNSALRSTNTLIEISKWIKLKWKSNKSWCWYLRKVNANDTDYKIFRQVHCTFNGRTKESAEQNGRKKSKETKVVHWKPIIHSAVVSSILLSEMQLDIDDATVCFLLWLRVCVINLNRKHAHCPLKPQIMIDFASCLRMSSSNTCFQLRAYSRHLDNGTMHLKLHMCSLACVIDKESNYRFEEEFANK